jgi:hypothetical protein
MPPGAGVAPGALPVGSGYTYMNASLWSTSQAMSKQDTRLLLLTVTVMPDDSWGMLAGTDHPAVGD